MQEKVPTEIGRNRRSVLRSGPFAKVWNPDGSVFPVYDRGWNHGDRRPQERRKNEADLYVPPVYGSPPPF